MKTALFYFKAFFQLLWKITAETLYYKGKYTSFKRACRLARQRFKLDHKTYWVVESSRWTFFVGNSSEIDKLKRMRVFDKKVDALYLDSIACYKIGKTCPDGTDYSARLTFKK